MKTIDIQAREWFDKVNGNSYFSAIITINYCMEDEKTIPLHFQYGYGDYYRDMAFCELKKQGIISSDCTDPFWRYCEDNKIILRCSKQDGCLKRDVMSFTARL